MIRKLHNTVLALVAASGLLALSLIAARPLALPAPDAAGTPAMVGAAATLEGQADTLAAMAESFDAAHGDQATAPAHAAPRTSHRGRQSVAMPFFSFAPRG